MHGKKRKKDNLPYCAVWPALFLFKGGSLSSPISLCTPGGSPCLWYAAPVFGFLALGEGGIDDGCGGLGLRFGLDDWNE